jgi:hypothetical protein
MFIRKETDLKLSQSDHLQYLQRNLQPDPEWSQRSHTQIEEEKRDKKYSYNDPKIERIQSLALKTH